MFGGLFSLGLKLVIFFGSIEHFGLVSQDSVNLGSQYVCVDSRFAEENKNTLIGKIDDVVYGFSNIFFIKVENQRYRILRLPLTDSGYGRTNEEKNPPINKPGLQSLSGSLYNRGFCQGNEQFLKTLTQSYIFHTVQIPFSSKMIIENIDDNSLIDNRYLNEYFQGNGNKKYLKILFQGKEYLLCLWYLDFQKLDESIYKDEIQRIFTSYYPINNDLKYTTSPNSLAIYNHGKYLFQMKVFAKDKKNLGKIYLDKDNVWSDFFQLAPIKIILYKKNHTPL